MGNFFRCSCNGNDEMIWFLILFLVLYWNNSNNNCNSNCNNSCNSIPDCGCGTMGINHCSNGCGCS